MIWKTPMAYMSELDIEMKNLHEDIKELKKRVAEEKEVADYWFNRCVNAEDKLHDEINYRPADRARTGYPTTD